MAWKKPVKQFFRNFKHPVSKFKLKLKNRLGWLGMPKILPFRGFANHDYLYLKGNVIEDTGLSVPEVSDSVWQNTLAMIKRFGSDVIPFVQIQITFRNQKSVVITDENGFFELKIKLNASPQEQIHWEDVHYELLDEVFPEQGKIDAIGKVMIATEKGSFGVISDVDDTILISRATSFIRKMRLMLFKNAHTRMPFEGVSAFYRALHEGSGNVPFNPIFYVSSSEWNLYDLLEDFCRVKNIPRGPFLLTEKDAQWYKFWKSGKGSHDHKYDKIEHVLSSFPNLPFILIGDSGQRDAEIYADIANKYPTRIQAIYIRDVAGNKKNRKVQDLAIQINSMNIGMLLVKTTYEAAIHASQHGFIVEDALLGIKQDVKQDQEAPTEWEYVTEFNG